MDFEFEMMRQELVAAIAVSYTHLAILSIDSYKHLKGEESPWERWEADLRRLHERLRSELGDSRLPTSVEMIHQMRAERDEQLANLR